MPQFGAWTDIGQLIVENWADVGLRAHIEVRERSGGSAPGRGFVAGLFAQHCLAHGSTQHRLGQ